MSAKDGRDLNLPLNFLKAGKYAVQLWKDAPDSESQPNHLTTESLSLSSSDKLNVHIAIDGGFVAIVSPSKR